MLHRSGPQESDDASGAFVVTFIESRRDVAGCNIAVELRDGFAGNALQQFDWRFIFLHVGCGPHVKNWPQPWELLQKLISKILIHFLRRTSRLPITLYRKCGTKALLPRSLSFLPTAIFMSVVLPDPNFPNPETSMILFNHVQTTPIHVFRHILSPFIAFCITWTKAR